MKVEKIYFDMDGVLADFERGVREICCLEPIPQDAKNNDSQAEVEMWEAIRKAGNFYDRLELMPGAKEMFDAVYGKYGDKCEILTGIPKLSKDIVVNIVYREEKPKYCSGKDCVLIDDFGKNIKEWEAIGGTGILSKSAESTLTRLKELDII